MKKKAKKGKRVLGVVCCGVALFVGGRMVIDKIVPNQKVVKAEEDEQLKCSLQKTDEEREVNLSFQKANEMVDGFYSGLFHMPLQPIANKEFTGEVREVYKKMQPFVEKYSDPKWSTIPEAEYDYTFSTVADVNAFFGFDMILHPLEQEEKVCVQIFGGNTGAIHAAYINTDYTLGGQKVKIANIIATEYSQYPTGVLASCGHTEMFSHLISLYAGMNGTSDDYTIEIMSTKDFSCNQSCYACRDLEVTVLETKQKDLVTVEMYFVINGVMYVAGMEVPEDQVADANTTLKGIVEKYVQQM